MGRTCCVQKLFLTFRTISLHNMFSPFSAKRRASDKVLLVPVALPDIFKKQNLRFGLMVLDWFARLKISEIKLKYATFKGSLYISCAKQMKR